MAQTIVVNGIAYQNCSEIDVPKQGSGTARFVDTSDGDAAASDIKNGKYAYVNGNKVQGSLIPAVVSQDGTTKVLSIS